MSVLNLSPAELSVVRDYISHGSKVKAAAARFRSVKTIEAQLHNARAKCGGVSLVQLCILVDRIRGVDIRPDCPEPTPERAAT